jgi:hypothetical protein
MAMNKCNLIDSCDSVLLAIYDGKEGIVAS